MSRRKITETQYRASRVCRVLGNPTAYQILRTLDKKRKTPSELAAEIGLARSIISNTLRNLRNIDVVRYETKLNERIYWVKEPIILRIINQLEQFVKRIRIKKW